MTNHIKYSDKDGRFKGNKMNNSGLFRKEACIFCDGKKFEPIKTMHRGRIIEKNRRCEECSGLGYVFIEEKHDA